MKRKKYMTQEQTAKQKEYGGGEKEGMRRVWEKSESERDTEWDRHKHTREEKSTLGRKSGGWRIEK